ncbi:MAG: hypothetical protein ACD_20C00435G0001 [uncultured bacterium]|nr:MAG: hypothetical protein ACD_20C00435G0001 [uncultured bacterium]
MYKIFSKNNVEKGLFDSYSAIKTKVAYCLNNQFFDYLKLIEFLNSDSAESEFKMLRFIKYREN